VLVAAVVAGALVARRRGAVVMARLFASFMPHFVIGAGRANLAGYR
jgi:hypothetical protein